MAYFQLSDSYISYIETPILLQILPHKSTKQYFLKLVSKLDIIKKHWDNATRDNDSIHVIFKKAVILCCFQFQ